MKAMILAAGRGERMRPLTDRCPKPLLAVGGKPLIVWHIERLRDAGVRELVINHAHLGQMLVDVLGDGAGLGVTIAWSPEPAGALETAGGIAHARPLLGEAPFIVVNGDIWCDADFGLLATHAAALDPGTDVAWLLLAANPAHHRDGDFVLQHGRVLDTDGARLTFSGVAAYHPSLFDGIDPDRPAKLAPLLRAAMQCGRVGGALHPGHWHDVGTPERLAEVDRLARQAAQG